MQRIACVCHACYTMHDYDFLSRLRSRSSSLRVIGCHLCLTAGLLRQCALVAPLRTSLSWWLCLVVSGSLC